MVVVLQVQVVGGFGARTVAVRVARNRLSLSKPAERQELRHTLTIAPEPAPEGAIAVAVIRPRSGGAGFRYVIPASVLPKLGAMNKDLDPRGRYDAVMSTDGLFRIEPVP